MDETGGKLNGSLNALGLIRCVISIHPPYFIIIHPAVVKTFHMGKLRENLGITKIRYRLHPLETMNVREKMS